MCQAYIGVIKSIVNGLVFNCSSPHAHTSKQLVEIEESEPEFSEEEEKEKEKEDKVISFRGTQGEEEKAEKAEVVCSHFQLLYKQSDHIWMRVCM